MKTKENFIDSVVGHKDQINYLVSAASNKNLSHAYLFVGEESIGKKKTAVFFAKSILCKNMPSCNMSCRLCNQIEKKTHPDVIFLEGDSSVKIEEVRKVISATGLKPFSSSHKIVIIDNAERLTEEASNALLKTLEEPAAHSVIILISRSVSSLLPTIISRSQIIKFFKVPEKDMDQLIEKAASGKKNKEIIKALSGGKPGVAIKAVVEKENTILVFKKNVDKLLSLFDLGISESFDVSSFLRSLHEKNPEELDTLLQHWTIFLEKTLKKKILGKEHENISSEYLTEKDFKDINFKMLNYVINYLIWSKDILRNPSSGLNSKLILDLLVLRVRRIKVKKNEQK